METAQYTNKSDASLVIQYIGGSEQALEILINKHQLQIFNFINSKINNREISRATNRKSWRI